MVVNGILPIDQLREHVSPMRLVCQRIPRKTLLSTYGVKLPVPVSASMASPPTQLRQPTVSELLDAFCIMRGFMASTHAGADHPRAARTILKDYCEGKLVYCHPPPSGWANAAYSLMSSPSLTAPSNNSSSSYSRVTLEDNVLLPTQQKQQQQQRLNANLPTVSPIRVSSQATSASMRTSSSEISNTAGDDIGVVKPLVDPSQAVVSVGLSDKKKLPELTEADLLAFSRVVPVSTLAGGGDKKNKNNRREAYELYEYESEEEDDEDEEDLEVEEGGEEDYVGSSNAAATSYSSSSSSAAASGGGGPPPVAVNSNKASSIASSSQSTAVSSTSKKSSRQPHVSGLGRFGQKKKGSREPDPYGTERIADAAMRKNVQDEIR